MTDIECTSTGPVSGKVILFEWDIVRNELIPNILSERIGYLKLYQKKNSFFVPNTNVHSLPRSCSGVLVAFCEESVSETKPDSITNVKWKLGMLLSHAWHATAVIEITLVSKFETLHKHILFLSNNQHL